MFPMIDDQLPISKCQELEIIKSRDFRPTRTLSSEIRLIGLISPLLLSAPDMNINLANLSSVTEISPN